jgi:hypothetical protein
MAVLIQAMDASDLPVRACIARFHLNETTSPRAYSIGRTARA